MPIARALVASAVSLLLVACASAPNDSTGSTPAEENLDLGSYSPSSAVTYADAHWNDGQGLCSEFTSRSLRAGGLGISVIPYVPNLVTALASVPYEEHTQGSSSVSARAGDVVIYSDDTGGSFCDSASSDEHNCGHACIVAVGGSSETGILVDCHNNAHYHLGMGYILGSGYSSYRIYHLSGRGGATPPGTEACSTDADCNGGQSGTGIVCGSSDGYCIQGCHTDDDCPSGESCAQTAPHWSCR